MISLASSLTQTQQMANTVQACYDAVCYASQPLHFPSFLSDYLLSGQVYTSDGSAICKYCDDVVPSQAFCEQMVARVRKFLSEKKLIAQVESKEYPHIYGRGYPVLRKGLSQLGYSHESQCAIVRLHVHPQEKKNLKEAIEFVNQDMEQAFKNEKAMESFLIKLNKIFVKGVQAAPTNPEGYRAHLMHVYRERDDQTISDEKHPHAATARRVKQILTEDEWRKVAYQERLSAIELQKINAKIVGLLYVAPHHLDVPGLIKQFIQELFQELRHPIKSPHEIASWAHTRYVQIHPHHDSNGKEGRVLFNMILHHLGQPVLVFPSDDDYTAAIEKEIVQPGAFFRYVKEHVIPWNEKNAAHLAS